MANRRWAWVKDVLVFAGLALLNFILVFPCRVILVLSYSPKKGFEVIEVWDWLFMTPVGFARELGWKEVAMTFYWVNPLIYGLMWWGAWRLWSLFRIKPSA